MRGTFCVARDPLLLLSATARVEVDPDSLHSSVSMERSQGTLGRWYHAPVDRKLYKRLQEESSDLPPDYEGLEASEWGLDWGDISMIRDRLALTPTERLQAAQTLMNRLLEVRALNGQRA